MIVISAFKMSAMYMVILKQSIVCLKLTTCSKGLQHTCLNFLEMPLFKNRFYPLIFKRFKIITNWLIRKYICIILVLVTCLQE